MPEGRFDSELHALIAGGITVALDFSRMNTVLRSDLTVRPDADEDGNYLPSWTLHYAGAPRFRLHLEEL